MAPYKNSIQLNNDDSFNYEKMNILDEFDAVKNFTEYFPHNNVINQIKLMRKNTNRFLRNKKSIIKFKCVIQKILRSKKSFNQFKNNN